MPQFGTKSDLENSPLEPIAIVGMACHLPGGIHSSSSLWDLLVQKGSVQTPKVPESRFNIDAHFHENLERPGSFNVLGGYFLDGRVENFDPTFFNMTPIEAMWLDPQQRKMLEVVYECFESAGVPLDTVAGSNTAVFVGSFTSDYQQMSIRDTDFRHNYAATGVDPGIISNRIGNTFNLKGPSFTINTACSSSVYAIHNACHALRARDCDGAVVGGVNLIVTVDQHMNTAKLGILSPTSTCHTFDATADGYGRAEGAGALYLKRLSDAIRDGDPVRGVVRSSAVNTNGKVPSMGITHPSKMGQEQVIRAAYKRANLDPVNTAYLECHGTGTPVGDPIEVKAVSNAMNDNRSKETPLLIGAIKANIGHSEAASGIFAVMKAALMTESGVIPGVAGFKNLNPEIDEKGWNVKIHADSKPWPKNSSVRRVGVNSFGYGGTNGHVIVEEVQSLYPWYWHGKAKAEAPYNHSVSRPFLVILSAHDKATLSRNIIAHGKVAHKFYTADLAYTLNLRRTRFPQRAFTIARDGTLDQDFMISSFKFGSAGIKVPQVGYIFTGQGAQWAQMGVGAMQAFPPFASTIKSLDRVLQALESPPQWTLEEALLAPPEKSKINEADIAQPVCTAVQIALVDLLVDWDITPLVSIGHSSGEIAAAYSAGLISAPEAIVAAFYRGFAVKHNAPTGTMLAVGIGAEEVSEYISDLTGDLVIACENSPSSVTLSGAFEAIQEVKRRLDQRGMFARELRTGKAYHSPQMNSVAPAYNSLLLRALQNMDPEDFNWRRPRTRMISSVTGKELHGDISPQYWSENLRNRVLFDTAVTQLGSTQGLEDVGCIIEIGPHSALAGPFKQICKARGFDRFTYIPTFIRNEDSAAQLLKVSGELFVRNYPVDLERVNDIDDFSETLSHKRFPNPSVLVDLPPYQWNYEKLYFAESRASAEQRFMKYNRHDILGRQIPGLSSRSMVWRNVLRHRDIPWLKDHRLGKEALFPAAGHLSLAIEGIRQISESAGTEVTSVTLRDIVIKVALVVPETDDGIEIQLRLQQLTQGEAAGDSSWYSFAVESISEGRWNLHCEGTIAANFRLQHSPGNFRDISHSRLTQRVPGKRWYDAFHRVGFEYGPNFQGLESIRTDGKNREAAADVEVTTQSGLMNGESRYILHPSTVDACLQLIIISINAGLYREMPWGVVPIQIEEVSLWLPDDEVNSRGHALAYTDDHDGRYFNTHTRLLTESGKVVLDIKSLRCVAYESAVPQQSLVPKERQPYMGVSWKPEITSLTASSVVQEYPELKSKLDFVRKMVELLDHKIPIENALLIGRISIEDIKEILDTIHPKALVTVVDTSCERLDLVTAAFAESERISTQLIAKGTLFNPILSSSGPQNVAIVDKTFGYAEMDEEPLSVVRRLVADKSRVILAIATEDTSRFDEKISANGFSGSELRLDISGSFLVLTTAVQPLQNGENHHSSGNITFVYNHRSDEKIEQVARISANGFSTPRVEGIISLGRVVDGKLVIYDVDGTLLSSLTADTFQILKAALTSGIPVLWLTAGVNEGQCPQGSMVAGFLRAIRSEQAMAKIALLDFDTSESVESIGNAVTRILANIATRDSGEDTEFWLHRGTITISRVIPNDALNDSFSDNLRLAQEIRLAADKALYGKITDGELIFTSDANSEHSELAEHELEVLVNAVELNSKDLQARSEGPRITAGTILRVFSDLDPSLVGRNCVTYGGSPYSTKAQVPEYLCHDFTGFEAADLVATLPSLCKVVNAVIVTAKVRKDEQMLLLPAPLPFVQAVVKLSKIIGFKLHTVVKSQKEKELCLSEFGLSSDTVTEVSNHLDLCTNLLSDSNLTFDVVIAHEFSILGQEAWRAASPLSRFVLSDGTLEQPPDVLPFMRGAAFLSVSVDSLYKRDQHILGCLLERTLDLLKEHRDLLTGNKTVYDIGSFKEILPAVKAGKDSENIVIKYEYGTSMVKVQPSLKELRFASEATYLLVGCLGGLGRSLTSWMMERGAKRFAFMSRSGADKPEAAQLVSSIEKRGAFVQVFRADASNYNDVEQVVSAISAAYPLRGVVHAAMVLQDSIFERMTYDKFVASITPKVMAAQCLHNLLKEKPLDFFVMTSSISATLGTPGQSNYCAGNGFLDGLAWHRNLQGLPAVSLILPMVLDVGYVADHHDIELSLSRKGMYGIDEQEMLRVFETAMMRPIPVPDKTSVNDAQIILGLEPAFLAAAMLHADGVDAFWYNDARFSKLRIEIEKGNTGATPGSGSNSDIMSLIKAAQTENMDAVLQAIAQYITKKLSSILMVPAENFDYDSTSIADAGLDSMIGAELRNWIFKEFRLEMSFQHLLAPTLTVKRLSTNVAEKLGVLKDSKA